VLLHSVTYIYAWIDFETYLCELLYGPTYPIVDIGIFMEYITTHVVCVVDGRLAAGTERRRRPYVTRPPRVNVTYSPFMCGCNCA
jgi:hypothetical protein